MEELTQKIMVNKGFYCQIGLWSFCFVIPVVCLLIPGLHY
jgi:hypothetical protein